MSANQILYGSEYIDHKLVHYLMFLLEYQVQKITTFVYMQYSHITRQAKQWHREQRQYYMHFSINNEDHWGSQ